MGSNDRRQADWTVSIAVKSSSPCPCGSGEPAGLCIQDSRVLHPPSVMPDRPKRLTGNVVQGCYAAHLHDCDGVLSGEHYVSHAVLKRLHEPSSLYPTRINHGLGVSGLFGSHADKTKRIPPPRLVSNILCMRHNEALSGLDAVGHKLFDALDEIAASTSRRVGREIYLFNGEDVERWLLKCVCGFTAAGLGARDPEIRKEWVEVLFGMRDFAEGQGLYIPTAANASSEGYRGIAVNLLSNWGDSTAIGGYVGINGFPLYVLMHNDGVAEGYVDGVAVSHRPVEIQFELGKDRKRLVFAWRVPTRTPSIHVRVTEKRIRAPWLK